MTETMTLMYLKILVRVMFAASVVHGLVTIVINMHLLDVNMHMSMTTFATHKEMNKFVYFSYNNVSL